ncbi:ABC transporter substrate-binding protein [Moraxella cuniculi]|uniref:Periplasmic oligopeptide-binding protein n=1 Tax=Moraxella cuniculi TaxID=34061 RepID=A0A448GXT7_9GAMM|nr:ABC transporter substrate-binding protein [Moraxella cuniculi]VEG13664.1 Periplasmic oligopeptide-binding protein precursor [Moraxella cuniculi]
MQFKPALLATALATVLGLTACGNSGSDSQAKTSGDAKSSATLPAGKDTLIIANGSEPATLDPTKSQDTTSSAIIRQMFEGLVSGSEKGETVPGLASKWETADNKVWTFTLRDAKWSNGEPITAHDAVYALQRLTDPNTAAEYQSYLADAKVLNAEKVAAGELPLDALGVKALDDKTLQITLTEAVPYLPDMFTLPVTFPVPKSVIEKYGDKWIDPANIVVSGAYKLKEWTVNSHVTLERNGEYYDNANTSIEKVQFLPITPANGINRYLAGELDVNGIPPEMIDKMRKDLPEEMKSLEKLCTYYLRPNTVAKPFDDPRVRQALSMGLDREIVAEILKRDAPAAFQFTPTITQNMLETKPQWAALDREKRNKQAIALLAEAGYNAQNPLKFEFLYSTSETGKMLAGAFGSMWQKNLANIVQPTLNNQEWKTFLDTTNRGKFSLSIAGWCADYNEPSSFLNILKTSSSNNAGKYSNPQFDAVLENALKAGTTDEDRAQLYKQAEEIIAKDTAVIPLYTAVTVRLVKPYVNGFDGQDPMDHFLVKNFSFKK